MGVLLRNVSQAEKIDTLTVPTKPDGSYYRYEMIADGGWSRYYDDSAASLMNFLIPGYLSLPSQERITARIKHAVDIQVRLQAKLNVFFSHAPLTSEERNILTGSRVTQPEINEWNSEVPLVLVDAFYAPYTDVTKPISGISDVLSPPNVWWLRPASSEIEYLKTLHEASLIDLHIALDEVA